MALNLDHQRDRITTASGNITINTAGSLRIPVGNTAQRPQTGVVQTGQIRFNTQLNEFEGYNGTSWRNIGGVVDADGDTFIDAEQTADDDTLRFYTNGGQRLIIDSTGAVEIYGDTEITQDLTVQGLITTTTLDVNSQATVASLNVEDLTQNRVVFVGGVNGELSDDNNLTFDGSVFDIDTIEALGLPRGTTLERPSSARAGYIRYNTDNGNAEFYDGVSWFAIGTGSGTVQEAFKTISVSGQGDVIADGPTDTLTLVEGTGITITTNPAGDEITISGVAQYGDADVDLHLNTSTATNNYVLSWNGTDYVWVDNAGYTDSDVDLHLNTSTATNDYVLSWNGTDYVWVDNAGYTDSDVDTHLNTSTATAGQVLSWDGTDYNWVAAGSGGGGFGDKIEDADGDTHVKVEANPDEDYVRVTTAGTERLSVDNTGVLTIGDSAGTTYYKFPTARGTLGQVLALDGSGNLTFQTVSGGGGGGSAVYFQDTAPVLSLVAGDLWFDTGTTGELYVYTGSEWISTTPGADASFITVNFVGDGSTVAFDTNANGGTVSMVFLNGVLIQPTNDYTETNGIVTFVQAPLLNDQIDVVVTGEVNALTLPTLGLANHNLITVDSSGNVTVNSMAVSDLTDNRIVLAGVGGELEDSANLTFDGNDLIIDTNSSIQIPVGTTLQRPTAATGQLRFNTDEGSFEGYDGTQWGAIGGGGELNIAGDSGTDIIDVENDTFSLIGGTAITTTVTNNQVAIALDNTAVTPGAYGSTTAIPVLTIDQQGRITAATTAALSVNKFATINVTDIDAGYTFAQTGSINAASDSDSLTFLGGTNVDIDIDTTNNVIKIDAVTSSAYTQHNFTGDGSTVLFSTSNTAIDDAQIFINGVLLDASDYSIAVNGDITFGVAPLLNDEIRVYAYSTDISVFSLAALGIANHDQITVDSSGNVTLTGTLTLAGDPTTNLEAATKQYVDAQLTAQDLDIAGDTGTGAVDLDSQSLTIAGTTNEIETSASGQTITVGLPNDVTIGNDLTVSNDAQITGNVGIGVAPLEKLHVDGAIRIDGVSNLETASTSLTTTAQTAIDSFATTKFRSCKYTVQATDTVSSEYQVVEILLIHDGTTAYVTTYGIMYTGSAELVNFDADISGGNVRLLATGASTNNTEYKVTRISTLV